MVPALSSQFARACCVKVWRNGHVLASLPVRSEPAHQINIVLTGAGDLSPGRSGASCSHCTNAERELLARGGRQGAALIAHMWFELQRTHANTTTFAMLSFLSVIAPQVNDDRYTI